MPGQWFPPGDVQTGPTGTGHRSRWVHCRVRCPVPTGPEPTRDRGAIRIEPDGLGTLRSGRDTPYFGRSPLGKFSIREALQGLSRLSAEDWGHHVVRDRKPPLELTSAKGDRGRGFSVGVVRRAPLKSEIADAGRGSASGGSIYRRSIAFGVFGLQRLAKITSWSGS